MPTAGYLLATAAPQIPVSGSTAQIENVAVIFAGGCASSVCAWAAAVQPNTRLVFVESPSNPHVEVADIPGLAELAHRHGALLAVDNVMCTPALQKPLSLGADVVVHSATKFLDGQGRCVGGAIVVNDNKLGDDLFSVLARRIMCQERKLGQPVKGSSAKAKERKGVGWPRSV